MGLVGDSAFGASIALAQAAPGPSSLYVAVLGYEIAGVAGAAATLAAFLLPTTVLALAAARSSRAHGELRAVRALRAGLVPIALAALAATCCTFAAREAGAAELLVTVGAALVVWRTRVPVAWIVAAGALLGGLHVI